jgi:hypothetical protein
MRTAVSNEDYTTTEILVIVITTIVASVANWPWPIISAFVALVALAVIVHVNILRPRLRRRRLKMPAHAWFVVPSKRHHGCDFAGQDHDEHILKTIVLPLNSEMTIDFRFKPRLFFHNSEIVIGCEGDTAPKAKEYFNRFVAEGEGKHIIPGPGNRHYIDKHGFYHYRESAATRQWSRETFGAMAFKFRTGTRGRYTVDIYFLGDEVEGKNSELTVVVEDDPQTVMRCTDRKHKRLLCATKGITPLSPAAANSR